MSTWIKAYNSLPQHPKMLAANAGSPCTPGWLFICGCCYSNEHLTDGFIPAHALSVLAPGTTKVEAAASKLVSSDLWHEVDGGWEIHDYGDVQRSADEVRRRRRLDAERKASVRGESARTKPGLFTDTSATSAQSPHSTRDSVRDLEKRREEGREDVEENNTVEASLDRAREIGQQVGELFGYWQERCGHSQAKLTGDRRAKLKARLAEGYSPEQIREAIDGAATAAFVNDAGKRFDDIELICRNGSKLESFIDRPSGDTAASAMLPSRRQQIVAAENAWHASYNAEDLDADRQARLDAIERRTRT